MCKVIEDMISEKEVETRLSDIKNIMETLKLTAEQALDALKISTSDRELYFSKLQQKFGTGYILGTAAFERYEYEIKSVSKDTKI